MTRGPDDPSDPESAPGSGPAPGGPVPGDPAPDASAPDAFTPGASGHSVPGDRDRTAEAFDAIVADWRREGRVPTWPGDDRAAAEPPRIPPQTAPPPRPPCTGDGPADGPAADVPAAAVPVPTADPDGQHDHFVPPEPPPLPRLGPPALVGVALLVLGLTLVTVPALVGVPEVHGLPLGLLTLAAGLGWFVLRLWPDPPDDRDADDDGAQI